MKASTRAIAMSLTGMMLVGCGSPATSRGDVARASSHIMFHVLGWGPCLYRLNATMSRADLGRELGRAVYHGWISAGFTIYEIDGEVPSRAVAFVLPGGPAYKGVQTGPACKESRRGVQGSSRGGFWQG
jgi:hypothetical protein